MDATRQIGIYGEGLLLSVYTFIASNRPLPKVMPEKEYPHIFNIDKGTFYDGGEDDNFYLLPFEDIQSYTDTDKKYSVCMELHYTDGRAKKILEYIKNALEYDTTIEIWHIWLMDYYEYDERPVIQKCTVPFSELTVDDIKEIDDAVIWNTPDKRNPGRPTFYCLAIEKG